VRLGHADANPLICLKLRRDKSPKKPELTDKEISQIREGLKSEPEWMQFAFDISLHTGCRLRETRLPMNCVDFKENKITFPAPKGGEDRAFSIPMPSALRPLLERLRKTKRKFTVEFPFQPSRRWQHFFIKIKKSHLCFHCLRVTFVNVEVFLCQPLLKINPSGLNERSRQRFCQLDLILALRANDRWFGHKRRIV
jgi:integrase